MANAGATMKFVPPLHTAFAKLGFTTESQRKIMNWSINSIAAWTLAQIQRAFKQTQAQPGGSGWEGLSQGWAEQKTFEGKSALIGTYTGELSNSFSGTINPTSVKSTEAVTIQKHPSFVAEIGTMVKHGGRFNDGRGFMPARPFIPVDSHVTRHWGRLHARILQNPEVIPSV